MKKITAILAFFICVTSACKKYGEGYVKGNVTQIGTNLPFPNAVLFLTRTKNNLKDGMAIFHEDFDSTLTDQDGHYSIRFDKERKYDYSVRVVPKGLVHYSGDYSRTSVELTVKNNTKDFSINPVSYLKIHLRKTTSSDNRAELSIGYSPYKTLVNHPFPFDTLLPVQTIEGNYKERFNWIQKSPDPFGTSIQHLDSLYTKAGDTLIYPITFQ